MKSFATAFSILIGFYSIAQEVPKNIKSISDDACQCISKIDINKSKEDKSDAIYDCITSANFTSQIKNSLLSNTDSLSKKDKNIIVLDENYKKIEEYIYNNCPILKQLYFTDNSKHNYSYSDRKKALKFYDIGQKAFQNEEYKKAIILFKKALKKDTKFAFAWDNLGYSYRKIGNYTEAIKAYKKSLALDPKGKMPLMNIAVAYQLNNDPANAIKAYQKFGEHYKDNPEVYYGLGWIYFSQKNYLPALENMIQAYLLYTKMKSPYNIDAGKHISDIYKELEKQDKLDAFYKIAKKYNLDINVKN